jgi:hypothetical protein
MVCLKNAVNLVVALVYKIIVRYGKAEVSSANRYLFDICLLLYVQL